MQNIYYQGNKKKQLPTGESSAKLEAFFNCAAALMTLQLQDLTLSSMQDFTDLIAQPPVRLAQLRQHSFTNLLVFSLFREERLTCLYQGDSSRYRVGHNEVYTVLSENKTIINK